MLFLYIVSSDFLSTICLETIVVTQPGPQLELSIKGLSKGSDISSTRLSLSNEF